MLVLQCSAWIKSFAVKGILSSTSEATEMLLHFVHIRDFVPSSTVAGMMRLNFTSVFPGVYKQSFINKTLGSFLDQWRQGKISLLLCSGSV